jgi:wyosine [tRNA(Phe)-imidazoG37] synthetase (radical SAM superfamily)
MSHRLVRFFAFNQEEAGTQRVIIQVEDTEERIAVFLEFLEISRPARAQVSSITHAPYEGEVPPLSEFRKNLNSEQLTKGINAILDIRESNKEINASNQEINTSIKDIKTSNQNIETIQKEMCAGQEEMIAKQDETITEVRGLRHDISKTFDERLNNIEEDQKAMKEAIQRLGVTVR